MKKLFYIFIIAISTFGMAADVYVSTVSELNSAIDNLTSGDVVIISNGTYNLTSTLVINNKTPEISDVTIRGITGNRDDVKLWCPGMGVYSSAAPHCFNIFKVQNLTIKDLTCGKTYWHPITVSGISNPDNLLFKNLRLLDAGEQFIKVNNGENPKSDNGTVEDCLIEYTDYAFWDGNYYCQGIDKIGGGDNWIVRGCTIKNVRPHPDHLSGAGGVGAAITFWQGGANNLIEKNTIINCRKGIEIGINDGSGLDAPTMVKNNFVYRGASEVGGDTGILVNDSPNTKVYNNSVILNDTFNPGSGAVTIEYRFDGSTGLEMKNNLSDGDIWHRTSGLNPTFASNITDAVAAWFVDVDNANLRLTDLATEAIDRGVTLAEVTDDIDGDFRPNGTAFDIGADEFISNYINPPDAPTGLAASDGTELDSVEINWNYAARATSYLIFRNTTNSTDSANLIADKIVIGSFTDTSVTAAATYFYWAKAVNNAGTSDFSNVDSGFSLSTLEVSAIEWKANGKRTKLIGKGITPLLSSYLNDGFGIGILDVEDAHQLETKNNKVWKYKSEDNTVKIIYKEILKKKKQVYKTKLIYKLKGKTFSEPTTVFIK